MGLKVFFASMIVLNLGLLFFNFHNESYAVATFNGVGAGLITGLLIAIIFD
jgi:hypothetical protein